MLNCWREKTGVLVAVPKAQKKDMRYHQHDHIAERLEDEDRVRVRSDGK